jgi:hypothetical protein
MLELTLVAAALVLILVLAVPRFQSASQRLGVERVAFQCTQLLRYARQRAVAQATPVVWAWDEGAREVGLFTLQELPGRAAHTIVKDDELVIAAEFAAGEIGCPAGVGSGGVCVQFFPDGTSEAAALTLSARGQHYTVTVDATTGQALLVEGSAHR